VSKKVGKEAGIYGFCCTENQYIHASRFENKNIGSGTLDNILGGRINSKCCGITAPLYTLPATTIQAICKSTVKIHKSRRIP